ncbi:MAG: Yop proteins translocation protein K [Puniceicoccales bacterium]|nr:Yop proteins translocation protein K [Puniceicoccales bacterium]
MESKAYISNLLSSDTRLFAAIYGFNNDMLEYMHPEFFPDTSIVQYLKPLMQSPRYRGEALKYLRQRLGIDNLGYYKSWEKRYWLCLFSAEEIQKIICYIGGVCFSEQIRKIILSRELLKLKQVIGRDAYLFSIRSAPLILRAALAERFQMKGKNLLERVLNTGKAIIEMSLARIPREIAQRFMLKFPKNFGWNFNHNVEDPQYYFDFIRKVVKRTIYSSDNVAVSMIKA